MKLKFSGREAMFCLLNHATRRALLPKARLLLRRPLLAARSCPPLLTQGHDAATTLQLLQPRFFATSGGKSDNDEKEEDDEEDEDPVSALHPMWLEAVDPATKKTYYYHKETQETRWTMPTSDGGADDDSDKAQSSSGQPSSPRSRQQQQQQQQQQQRRRQPVLLFDHDRSRYFRLMTGFAALQTVYWGQFAYWQRGQDVTETAKAIEGSGLMGSGLTTVAAEWAPYVSFFGLGASALFLVAIRAYGQHLVARLEYEKRARRLSIWTHGMLGSTAEPMVVPLASLSLHRPGTAGYFTFKIDQGSTFMLVDREGKIPNQKELEKVLDGKHR